MPVSLPRRKKVTFVVNPGAGHGAAGRRWPRIRAAARDRLGPFAFHLTTRKGQGRSLTRQALNEGAEVVVCVGGDGTLNEVINGFMGESGSVRTEAVLGYLPCGTGSDFSRTVHLPADLHQALDLIAVGQVRALDLGRVTYRDHQGRAARALFHNVTSFGLGGEVDARVNRGGKRLKGFVLFLWATLASLMFYRKKPIRMKVDEGYDETFLAWNVAVANGQYHGGGMRVAPAAAVDDGLFHVTIIGDLTLPEIFLNLRKLYNGRILDVEKVGSVTGKRVEAFSDHRVLIDMDGEQPGELPLVIDMVPHALGLIAPS